MHQQSIGIKSIKRNCIRDHIDCISSYIHNNQIGGLSNNYKKGIDRYSDIKSLMYDITLHYPQLMGFMLNPNDSKTCIDDICKQFNQQGGGDGNKIIDHIRSVFESFKISNPTKAEKIKEELSEILRNIDSKLIMLKNDDDTDFNMLFDTNSLIDISESIKKLISYYLDSIKTRPILRELIIVLISSYDIDHLKKNMEIIKAKANLANDASVDIFDLTSSIIHKITQYTFNMDSNQLNQLDVESDLLNLKIDIKNNLIYPIIKRDNVDVNIDPVNLSVIFSDCNYITKYMSTKIHVLNVSTTQLVATTNKIIDHLYGESPDKLQKCAIVRSHILPELNEMIDLAHKYIQTINDSHPVYSQIRMMIHHYNQMNSNNDRTKFIDIYNSLIKNNDNQNYQIVDNLNIFSAEMNRINIIKILNVSPPINDNDTEKVRLLNALKSEKHLMNSLIMEIKTEKDARLFIHAYNVAMYDKNPNNLANIGLPSCIKLVPYAYFVKEYTSNICNNIFDNIDEHHKNKMIMLNSIVDSLSKCKNESKFKHNNDSGKSSIKNKRSQKFINPSGEYIDLNYTNNDVSFSHCIILLSISEMKYLDAIKRYKDAKNKYDMAYNDMYEYIKHLILIGINQHYAENKTVYKYLNKNILDVYKQITSKMVQDLDMDSANVSINTNTSHTMNNNNVVIRHLNVFLNRLSTVVQNNSDIIDIDNLDSTSANVRNDMMMLNYFKHVLESYPKQN